MTLGIRAYSPGVRRVCARYGAALLVVMFVAGDLSGQSRGKAVARNARSSASALPCSTPAPCAAEEASPGKASPWLDRDIGNARVAGGSGVSGDLIAVAGAGTGLSSGDRDQFHLTYQRISGDAELIARVDDIDAPHRFAAAGVMLRASLQPDAPYVALTRTVGGALTLERRLVAGWQPASTTLMRVGGPEWLRLERRGAVISAWVSSDGAAWTFAGNEVLEGDAFYAGLLVASNRPTALATAVFGAVTLTSDGVSLPGTSPVTPLPAPAPAPDPVPPPPPPAAPAPEPEPDAPPPAPAPTPEPDAPPPAPAPAPSPAPAPAPAPTPLPVTRTLVFEPSADHQSGVDRYVLEVVLAGLTQTVVLRQDVGKPAVIGGECRVEVTGLLALLPPGTYVASVRAVNAFGASTAATSSPFGL